MNPFVVFFIAVFLLIPFLLLTIALANDLTGIFYAIDGSSFTPVANIVNYMLWAFVILGIALIAVMIIYRKYT
jgi:TRAP-type mannitol/chloroaromatic compound transport system permease small subunit